MPRTKVPIAQILKLAVKVAPSGILKAGKLTASQFNRLKKEEYLMPITAGWYALVRPHLQGDSTAFTPFYWPFVAQYLSEKYGRDYTVGAEQSLDYQTGETAIPEQLIIITKSGSNQTLNLPFGKSILMYVSAHQVPLNHVDYQGVNLMPLEEAITRSTPETFKRNPIAIRLGLSLAQEAPLAKALMEKGPASASRIIPILEEINPSMKISIEKVFKNLNFSFSPTPQAPCSLQIIRGVSPVVTRFQDSLNRFQDQLESFIPALPAVSDLDAYQKQVEVIKVSDIYNSLSIEGYQVTTALIERIEKRGFDPGTDPDDLKEQAALAAKGYSEAFKKVVIAASESFSGKNPALVFSEEHQTWYQELFLPMVTCGILQKHQLAGYRANPVYIRNATHVPPQPSVVPDLMDNFVSKLSSIPNPFHAGILGHYGFVAIHPYSDGNGRLSRFLMNLCFAHAKIPWTVIKADRRHEYFQALEKITTEKTILPFAEFLVSSISTL